MTQITSHCLAGPLGWIGILAHERPNEREHEFYMAYVIVDGCTKDEHCVEACPTDCIHPKSIEEKFEAEQQMYVDPEGCIDCGACVAVCPTNSIYPEGDVPAEKQAYVEKNKAFFAN